MNHISPIIEYNGAIFRQLRNRVAYFVQCGLALDAVSANIKPQGLENFKGLKTGTDDEYGLWL